MTLTVDITLLKFYFIFHTTRIVIDFHWLFNPEIFFESLEIGTIPS